MDNFRRRPTKEVRKKIDFTTSVEISNANQKQSLQVDAGTVAAAVLSIFFYACVLAM